MPLWCYLKATAVIIVVISKICTQPWISFRVFYDKGYCVFKLYTWLRIRIELLALSSIWYFFRFKSSIFPVFKHQAAQNINIESTCIYFIIINFIDFFPGGDSYLNSLRELQQERGGGANIRIENAFWGNIADDSNHGRRIPWFCYSSVSPNQLIIRHLS